MIENCRVVVGTFAYFVVNPSENPSKKKQLPSSLKKKSKPFFLKGIKAKLLLDLFEFYVEH